MGFTNGFIKLRGLIPATISRVMSKRDFLVPDLTLDGRTLSVQGFLSDTVQT